MNQNKTLAGLQVETAYGAGGEAAGGQYKWSMDTLYSVNCER